MRTTTRWMTAALQDYRPYWHPPLFSELASPYVHKHNRIFRVISIILSWLPVGTAHALVIVDSAVTAMCNVPAHMAKTYTVNSSNYSNRETL